MDILKKSVWAIGIVFAAVLFAMGIIVAPQVKAATVDENDCVITGSNIEARPGSTVEMNLELQNNPGISYLRITVIPGTGVTLNDVKNGNVISDLDVAVNLLWSANKDSNEDGLLATLTLDIAEDAENGDIPVEIIIRECYDEKGEPVAVKSVNSLISISDVSHGDVNGDGKIEAGDFNLIYNAFINDIPFVSEEAKACADVNGNGIIDAGDYNLIYNYVVYDIDFFDIFK